MKRALFSLVALGGLIGLVGGSASANDWAAPRYNDHRSFDAYQHGVHDAQAHRGYDYGYSRGYDFGHQDFNRGYGHSNYGYGHPSYGYGQGGHIDIRPSRSHWSFGFGW